jgi:glycine/D-amino acid oxidase-like deaminating enzyme
MLWGYHTEPCQPVFPPRFDPLYPEVVLRGLSRMVPALGAYLGGTMHRPFVDGGYYCKTRENRLLVGPTPIAGFYVLCGLSGYGIMASLGSAEVLGTHVVGGPLPPYARELALARYQDPEYLARLPELGAGQL